ncbi:transmembrane protein 241 isoform X1 [Cervus canadensis]|uniref:transmembrane protein 241 isoform X1 n=2 Tax=Cervus canadensis TaxID=1574408 RepID=UPI001CA343C2|nr:transmembrane protein 241 isoform X1 [Cervus canadensis]
MCVKKCLVGLTFCTCYLASYLTNKYVLSVLKFTYPTLFQGWQTLVAGLLLHVSWKLGWVEINSRSRSDVLTWLPASVLFVGIIYAGSRALSRLAIPVFLTLHNAAEVIICGHQKCFRKEKTSPAKICSALFLLAAAGCLPFNDSQFDPDGYFWAVIHLLCIGAYKILQKSQKPNKLSDIDQQYLNYLFSVVLLALAAHPTGDLLSVLDFPFLYFYGFHGSCCASGFLGFFLMFSTMKLKSLMAPGQCAAWIFFAKMITSGLSMLLFDIILTKETMGCQHSGSRTSPGHLSATHPHKSNHASCSADLERPCWFSQSGRAPKPGESGLPGCSGEHRAVQVIESKDGEVPLLAAARTIWGL